MSEFDVNLRELQAWSDQVGRSAGHMEQVHGYAASHLSDGDFGRILSLVTGDYQALLQAVASALGQAATNLAAEREALADCVRTYRSSDDAADHRFGAVTVPGEG